MAVVAQKDRLITINTPLGKDELLVESIEGSETLSGLFEYSLRLLSKKPSLAFASIVGKNASVKIQAGSVSRDLHGFVCDFSQGDQFFHTAARAGKELYTRYDLTLVPWVWNLTQTSDCRIFQNKSATDIIKQVFDERGFKDYKLQLSGSYSPRVYCVQYRETDFNFVSRLMEEEGIYYYFEHTSSKHTMILGDSPSAHQACPGQSSATYAPQGGPKGKSAVTQWAVHQGVRTAKSALADYNFETPSTDLKVNAPTKVTVGKNDKLEIYDYEGRYQKKGDGEKRAKIRMEEHEATHTQIAGASDCFTFTAGCTFKLTDHYRSDCNGEYVLTRVAVFAQSNVLNDDADSVYHNTFACIPKSVPYRPQRVALKPTVRGTQTAIVVGKSGEEIWTDKYGRIKVQFHWDRKGKKDENSSCWVRVANPWAGKQWGAVSIPRIGQEVVVDFLEGDPDQPLIIGSVYNAEQMPHYELPAEQTKSYVKSNSSKGGKGFNELRFEDKAGQEQIFIHGERNLDTRVKNDRMENILGNSHLIVGSDKDGKKTGDQRELVYQDKHLNVKRHQVEKIEGNLQLTVGKGDAQGGGNFDLLIEKKLTETVEGESNSHVKKNRSEKVDGTASLSVGGDLQEKVGKNHALEAGMEIHVKAGMKLILEAGMQLSLKGPGGFIDIGPAGVTIQGTLVNINSGGSAGSGSGAKPASPQDAAPAQPTQPTDADDSKTGSKSAGS